MYSNVFHNLYIEVGTAVARRFKPSYATAARRATAVLKSINQCQLLQSLHEKVAAAALGKLTGLLLNNSVKNSLERNLVKRV